MSAIHDLWNVHIPLDIKNVDLHPQGIKITTGDNTVYTLTAEDAFKLFEYISDHDAEIGLIRDYLALFTEKKTDDEILLHSQAH